MVAGAARLPPGAGRGATPNIRPVGGSPAPPLHFRGSVHHGNCDKRGHDFHSSEMADAVARRRRNNGKRCGAAAAKAVPAAANIATREAGQGRLVMEDAAPRRLWGWRAD